MARTDRRTAAGSAPNGASSTALTTGTRSRTGTGTGTGARGAGDVLDRRALSRATLARQLLLERHRRSALDAVHHLVGLQAQAPQAPYVGLWTRLTEFSPDELSTLLTTRQVVRLVVMRGTIHLVTADDARSLRPLAQPLLDRDLRTNAAHARHLREVDLDTVVAVARQAYEEQPLSNREVAGLLARDFPGAHVPSLAHAVRNLLPLVQVPPRGLWGRGGQVTCTTLDAWVGPAAPAATAGSAAVEQRADAAREALVLRYLAAFGPASVRDVQTWWGVTGLAPVLERLRPRLRTFRSTEGRELFDVPDAPRPPADTPAPVRLLPEYDNLLVAHAERDRLVDEDHRRSLQTPNGVGTATVLVDGFVAGRWRVERERERAAEGRTGQGRNGRDRTTVVVDPLVRLGRAAQAAVTEEAAALARLLADGTGDHDVHLALPLDD